MKSSKRTLTKGLAVLLNLFLLGTLAIGLFLLYIESQLPDVSTLKTVQLQVPLRIYTKDEKLIAEFGEKHRKPVTFEEVPKLLIQAVLATEDKRFYEHAGIDFLGLLRAAKKSHRNGEQRARW